MLNFQLKDGRTGGAVEIDTGLYRAGDGASTRFAGNIGLPLGAVGFANLSLEYGTANPTDRSGPRRDADALIAAGNTHVRSDNPQAWGDPRVDDDLKGFGNFGYTLPAGVQAYAHTSYARKTVTLSVFYRNPNTRLGVFSNDRGRTLLVGDVLAASGTGSADCPTVTVTDDVPDPVALEQVIDNPNCFTFQELFPGGFTPRRIGTEADASVVGGLRGTTAGDFDWDLSASLGVHRADFFVHGHRQRLARPDVAPRIRHRHEPAAGRQRQPRPVVRTRRPRPRRRRRRMARGAVRPPGGRPRGMGDRPVRGAGLHRGLQRPRRLQPGAGGHVEPPQPRGVRRPRGDRRR